MTDLSMSQIMESGALAAQRSGLAGCPECGEPVQPSTFGKVCCTSSVCDWRGELEDLR